jgi:4-hydroxy-tetrahydrodipicolinate synthase
MFQGVFVAIVTPFKDGKVDAGSLHKHASWLALNGVNGILACGTTGEAATLHPEEYAEVVKAISDAVSGKCKVIAGAGANCTEKAIELAKLVTEAGASATLQVTPYYNKPPQKGLIEHFKAVASEVKTAHILYNVPGRTSVNMLPETVAELATIKNIVGIKEASGDLEQVKKIRELTPPEFVIMSGCDDQNLEIYKLGGNGAISVTANIAPADVSNVWKCYNEGKKDQAEDLQKNLARLNDIMFVETNPIPVKTSLSLMGYCLEEFRLPLTTIDPQNKEKLQSTLKFYKLA